MIPVHARIARLLLALTFLAGCNLPSPIPPSLSFATSITPTSGVVGTPVTLKGMFFRDSRNSLEIRVCNVPLVNTGFSGKGTQEVVGEPAFAARGDAFTTVTGTIPTGLTPGTKCPVTAFRTVDVNCDNYPMLNDEILGCTPGPVTERVENFYPGTFTILGGARLGPPTALQASVVDGTLTLDFTPPELVNGPITTYWSQLDDGDWTEQPVTGPPMPLPELDTSVSHRIVIAAEDAAGRGDPSEVYTWTPPPEGPKVPNAPTQLQATPGDGQASIAFTAPFDGGSPITQYEASVNDGAFTALPQATPGSPVTVTGLTNGVKVNVRLRAVNAVGPGKPSLPVEVTPFVPRVPDAPTNLRARPADGGAVIGFGVPYDGGSTILRYEYSVGSGPWSTVAQATPGSPVTITGLQNGTQVGVSLRAVNAVGAGAASTVVFVTPRPVREPDAPTHLVAMPLAGSASVAFTVPYDGGLPITSYESSVDSGPWTAIPQGNTPGTPVTVTGLTDGVSVSIRLRAVNDVGPGAPSLPVSVTPHPPTVPDAPINLSAVAGQGQATLSFTAPYDGGSAILRYEVRVGSGGTFAPANQAAPGSPITVTGLTNGVAVDLSVRAVNAVGAGAASTVSVTPVTPQPMVLVVDTNSGNPGSSVALPLSGAVDVTIDWGGSTANAPAGECPTTVQSSLSTTTRCTYDTPGQYTVQISGTLEGFGLGKWAGYALAEKIIKVTAWGSLNLQSLEAAFSPVSMIANSGIEEVPADFPATVTNLSYAFCKTSRFNQPLDTWDVSHVTLMEKTFSQSNFNASIADWDTRAVTSLWGFAMSNTVFNQPMDAHEVTRFGRTYTAWDVRNVTVFSFAFMGASAFNQTLEHWDTSAAQEFSMTFSQTGVFNQPINTNEVTVGGRTYLAWDVSKVTKMNDMFLMAKAFNQPLDAWNTSNVTTLANMFTAFGLDTMPFNQPLDTHEVTVGGQTYVAWNVGKVTDMSSMFGQSAFNQPLAHWDTRNVTTLASMFAGNKVFNQSLSPTTVNVGPLSYLSWDTSKVTTLESMFVNARDFNGDVGLWDTSSVTNLNSVFSYATAFNQDLSAWNTANVTQMKSTFSFTNAFNQPLASWNTGKVTTMMQMFQGATAFNQPLGAWNTSQVTSMQSMFSGATSFAQDLSTWCVALISGSPGNQSFSNNSPLAFTPAHLPNWGVACTP